MTGALLFYLAAAGAGLAMVLNGYGQHTFWLDPLHTQNSLKASVLRNSSTEYTAKFDLAFLDRIHALYNRYNFD